MFVLIVPLAGYILVHVSKMMRRAVKKVLEQMSAMYKLVRETFDSIRVAKAFTREPRERRKFRAASREYLRKAMRMIYIDAATGPIVEVLLVMAVGLALGVRDVSRRHRQDAHLGPPDGRRAARFPGAPATVCLPGRDRRPGAPAYRACTPRSRRAKPPRRAVFEVFDREARVRANPDGPRLDEVREKKAARIETRRIGLATTLGRPPSPRRLAAKLGIPREQLDVFIEFRHVCFAYNPDNAETPALDNVCLTVKAGEVIAVVGGNGSGKTTLLGLLPRFYDPDSGAV